MGLDTTIYILDFLYRGREFQRFWVLEVIARAPYFSFISVLHFRESLGLRGEDHYVYHESNTYTRHSMKRNTWKITYLLVTSIAHFYSGRTQFYFYEREHGLSTIWQLLTLNGT